MTLRAAVALGVAGLFVAALVVPRLVGGRGGAGAAVPAPGPEPPLRVDVVRVEPRPLEQRLSTTGSLRANESVDLVSEVAGIVERIQFREGTTVAAGELLVEIEDTELRAQRDRVLHRLELAEAREARQRDLRAQGIVSEQDFDLATSELNVLRAELRLVDAQLEKTEIRAPFAGVIGLRYVSTGSLLSPQTRIATLQDLDPLKVDFTLPEKYAGRIGAGDRVEFRVEGSELQHVAEVYAVEPRITQETRSLLIRLAVERLDDALVVPSLAVIPELGGHRVFVVVDGKAEARPVETGIRTETEVQIASGLVPGEQVIVSAIQRLRPGLAVTASEPAR
jgi:membrane fusion protein (multidrug efflux system)